MKSETDGNTEKETIAPDGESTHTSWSQFDELAALYEESSSWPYRRYIEIPNILRLIGNLSNLSILDYGCGTGIFSRWLKGAGAARVVGFDPCLRMLEYAKEKSRNLGTEIEFTSELVPEIYDGQFDLVLAVYVLPYAHTKADLNDMCTRMGNLVKPGGRLITVQVHPEYNLDPDYYAEYLFRIIPQDQSGETYSYIDGGRVQLHICYDKWDVRIMATYWSMESLKHALVGAGFSSATQIDLCKIDVDPKFVKYVNQPHASIIECRK